MTDVAVLTHAAQITLAACEQRIERGLRTFLDIGQALGEIRDSRLYRATHETFEAYCQERWEIDRTRAQNFITAARAVLEISNTHPDLPAPAKESQARALAAVPDAERADVWRAVVEGGEKITAEAIRKAAETLAKLTDPDEADFEAPTHPNATGEPNLAAPLDYTRIERAHSPGPTDAAATPPADSGASPAPAAESPVLTEQREPAPTEAEAPREGGASASPADAERAAAAVDAALAKFVPDPDAEKRAWVKKFYELNRPVHTFLLWLKTEDVTAYADEQDLTTLRHLATSFTEAHRRAVEAGNANVTQLRRVK